MHSTYLNSLHGWGGEEITCSVTKWKTIGSRGSLDCIGISRYSSQEHFKKYYDAVMPYLKAILVNATDKSNRMLRAKAMECISLVGMVVGKESLGMMLNKFVKSY
ncbi:uncharacterized protein LOC110702857 [Chenopodium quinoa]|uniref:uncharacterized protein LOC110702857 n=1 Tax=Chenopodium quinoa TaxID=63459 RepID=UPI000B76C9BD|nr:uncharacterized protein LOC110702857 [Chenopodium quinoa]